MTQAARDFGESFLLSAGSEAVDKSDAQLDLRYLLPAANENRWSDLLATMIAADPAPMSRLLGVEVDEVRREVIAAAGLARASDRLDLLLLRGGSPVAVVEVKVLADLGPRQLTRYLAAFPDAQVYRVLHLGSLPVNLKEAQPWQPITWDAVLDAYAASGHCWVRQTAQAWRLELDALVPVVGPSTVWNDVPEDAAGFELALRTRVAWLASQADQWCEINHDAVQSSGGGNWGLRMWAPAAPANHYLTVEMQEGMTAYEWRFDPSRPYRDRLAGPVVLLGLRLDGSDSSAGFAWKALHRAFATHILDEAGNAVDGRAWHTTAARPPDPTDKAKWLDIVAAGAPRWLGKGWGMRVARTTGSCLFGARYGLSPDITLGALDAELRSLQPLVLAMVGSTDV